MFGTGQATKEGFKGCMEVILRSEDADLSRPSKIMWTNMRQVPKTHDKACWSPYEFRIWVSNHPRIIPGACSLHEWTVFHASLSGQNEREHGISRYQICNSKERWHNWNCANKRSMWIESLILRYLISRCYRWRHWMDAEHFCGNHLPKVGGPKGG